LETGVERYRLAELGMVNIHEDVSRVFFANTQKLPHEFHHVFTGLLVVEASLSLGEAPIFTILLKFCANCAAFFLE